MKWVNFLSNKGERVLGQSVHPEDQAVLIYVAGYGDHHWSHPNIDRIVARDIVAHRRQYDEQSSVE